MLEFILIMAICGGAAAFHLSWVFVSLVGFVAVPAFCAALILWSGTPLLSAILKVGAGYIAFQVSYVFVGIGIDRFGRRAPHEQGRLRVSTGRHSFKSQPGSPLFGGWLPLLAFYDPPCRADGSPWDGREDPGFRITTLVFGWFGYGVSVTVGAPRPVSTSTPDFADQCDTIDALDAQIRKSRERKDSVE